MCPQPLSKFKNRNLNLSLDAIKERPELASKIMRVISTWSIIDIMYTELLCSFLESDLIITMALYNTVINSSLKTEMVAKAAEKALSKDPQGLELFTSTQDAIKASRDCRNRFAHYLWCIAPKIENSICLLNPSDYVNVSVSVEQHIYRRLLEVTMEDVENIPQINNKKVMVYRNKDLDTEVNNALQARELMRQLQLCFDRTGHLIGRMREKAREKLAAALQHPS